MSEETPLEEVATCELGSHVQASFFKARDARVNTDRLLLDCLRLRKGEYAPEEMSNFGAIKTFVNTTSTKCRAGEAWLNDIILASTRECPFVIDPTPIPNTPSFVRDTIIEKIKTEITSYGVEDDKAEEYIRARAADLKPVADAFMMEKAKDAAQKMSDKIQDQLLDAGFNKAFSSVRSDLMTYPYAVLKGPVIRNRKMMSWGTDGKNPEVKIQPIMCVERVSPFDFYWAPWATNPNEGYLVETMRMEQKALYACIGLPNFNEDKIREALSTYSEGYTVNEQTRSQREILENNTHYITSGDTIDVLDYWGSIRGDMLKEWGVSVEDKDASYEVNAWVVGDICIRAVLNPDPLGKRPYYVSSYEKVPGTLVGRSIPMLMRPHQEIINSAYRSLRRNMGLASGPFAEVDQSRLAGGQIPEEIMPGMVKLVEPDMTGSGQAVYRFHQINSHAQELLAVISNETRACDDATGIPAYSYGNAGTSGAGRTVGGLAMLMGNASKGLKMVVGHIEQDILEPLIQSMYNYNMLYDDDESIKVDAQIVARGPTGIIMRNEMVQRRMEGLQLISPYMQTGIVKPEGIAVLLRETLRGLELPVDKIIPDPEKQKVIEQAAGDIGSQQAPQGGQAMPSGDGQHLPAYQPDMMNGSVPMPSGKGQLQMQPGQVGQGTTPTPILDGRSAPTQMALQSMHSV